MFKVSHNDCLDFLYKVGYHKGVNLCVAQTGTY